MKQNDGVYLPPDIVLGRQVFFTIDNIDSQKALMMVERLSMGQVWLFTKSDDTKMEVRFRLNNIQFVWVRPYY